MRRADASELSTSLSVSQRIRVAPVRPSTHPSSLHPNHPQQRQGWPKLADAMMKMTGEWTSTSRMRREVSRHEPNPSSVSVSGRLTTTFSLPRYMRSPPTSRRLQRPTTRTRLRHPWLSSCSRSFKLISSRRRRRRGDADGRREEQELRSIGAA